MGQYDFTYEIPDDFKTRLVRYLQQNGFSDIASVLQTCLLDHEDLGLAYYAGLKGDNWDKKALDFTIEGSKSNISFLQNKQNSLKEAIHKLLHPTTTGYLVRKIDFIISDNPLIITLPDEHHESFETLSRDIHDALGKNEPALVLDRLHTYSVRLIREICNKHSIPVEDEKGNRLPIHSLMGALVKFYNNNNFLESEFASQALKMSISIFEKYNTIRNTKSYAHDNEILGNAEAEYVVTVVTATLSLIHRVEQFVENES